MAGYCQLNYNEVHREAVERPDESIKVPHLTDRSGLYCYLRSCYFVPTRESLLPLGTVLCGWPLVPTQPDMAPYRLKRRQEALGVSC